MNAPAFELLERAFDEVFALDPPSRDSYLQSLRSHSPEVADRLSSMLAVDCSGVDAILRNAASEPPPDRAPDQRPGSIGPYRILGQIGEGGFGIVYLAEQPEPVHRLVAVKVIKPGMDTRAVLSRFRDESQALALMDHPSVVAAIEAGTTDDRRPYVVMPLLPGLPVTAFAKEQKLDLKQRVALMIGICRGVQHAHSRGVIHRDLKPSNVLVASVDGEPQPKIIDFGLAKALASPLTPHATLTVEGQLVGTPEYMSPEQAHEHAIDIRSDVYALGAILYELVAGRPPFTREELRADDRESLKRTLAQRVPAPPSRYASAPVPRELDWIALRCLEKEPARRFQTAEALAEDLARFVDGRAVVAGPPARFYRLIASVRHHKALAGALAAIMLSLAAGTAVSVGFAIRERAERRDSEQVADFLRSIFTGLDPIVAQGKDRELLMLTLDQASNRLAGRQMSPEVEARLSDVLASSYRTIGEYRKSYPYVMRALELYRLLYGRDDPRSITTLREMIETRMQGVRLDTGPWYIPDCQELEQLANRKFQPGSREWIECMYTARVGSPYDYQQKLQSYPKLVALSESSLGPADRLTLKVMRRAAKELLVKPQWCLDMLFEARRRAADAYGENDPDVEAGLALESFYLATLRGTDAAIEYLQRRIPHAEQALGALSQPVFTAKYNLGSMLLQAGRFDEAEPYLLQAHELAVRKHGEGTGWETWVDANLLELFLRTRRFDQAREVEARIWKAMSGGVGVSTELWVSMIQAFRDAGQPQDADRVIAYLRGRYPDEAAKVEKAVNPPAP